MTTVDSLFACFRFLAKDVHPDRQELPNASFFSNADSTAAVSATVFGILGSESLWITS